MSRFARAALCLTAFAAACGPVASHESIEAFKRRPHAAGTVVSGQAPAVASMAGGRLAAADGAPVALHGFSWFGYNDGTGQLAGLWQATEPLAGDFATVVWRQKLLGFNAVRLPFSFKELAKPARNMAVDCRALAAGEVGQSTVAPDAGTHDGRAAPPLPADVARPAGKCNTYLPTDSQRAALLWTVRFYLDNGFYLLVDNHLREDSTALDDADGWAKAWAALATDLYALPGAEGRIFLDLLNEPDQFGLRWAAENGKKGVGDLYLAAMDAIEAAVPRQAIFFVEGTGQSGINAAWGDGYCTDPARQAQSGLSDPRPFFQALVAKPYAGRVGLAPHVYGPDVTTSTQAFKGPDLFARLSASFGALNMTGFAPAGHAAWVPPVAIGEFGSKFQGENDPAFMVDFAAYLRADGAAQDHQHQAIPNWFYWAWNANSGDTGGLVADDWRTLQWGKLKYLGGLGLRAWYAASPATSTAAPAPAPNPPAASQAPATAAAPVPTQTIASGAASAPQARAPKASSAPPPAPSPKTQPAPAPGQAELVAVVHHDASWEKNGKRAVAVNIVMHLERGADLRTPYTVELRGPAFAALDQVWNVQRARLEDGAMRAEADAQWQQLSAEGGEFNFGLIFLVEPGQPDAITAIRAGGREAHLVKP